MDLLDIHKKLLEVRNNIQLIKYRLDQEYNILKNLAEQLTNLVTLPEDQIPEEVKDDFVDIPMTNLGKHYNGGLEQYLKKSNKY